MAARRGREGARFSIDGEIGPVLVGLRTLEWRWDRLADIGVDPGEMLGQLADRASGIAKMAGDCGELTIADHAEALGELVASIANRDLSAAERREALGTAVLVAADLHHAAEVAARRG